MTATEHMDRPWFPVSALRWTGRVVEIRWGFYQGPAVLLRKPKGRGFYWVTRKDGETRVLPPKGQRNWSPEPHSWRPIGSWSDPLPEPISPQFQSRETLERPQTGGMDRPQPSTGPFVTEQPWWHGAHPIWNDSDARHLEAVEYRVLRAVAQIDCAGAPTLAVSGTGGPFMSIEAAAEDLERSRRDEVAPKFRPSAHDISDFDVAMDWFAALNPPELRTVDGPPGTLSPRQWAIFYRSRPVQYTFNEIAERLGYKDWQMAQYYYRDAMERCCNVANGKRAFKWIDPKASIKQVHARNQAWKLQQRETAETGNETNAWPISPR